MILNIALLSIANFHQSSDFDWLKSLMLPWFLPLIVKLPLMVGLMQWDPVQSIPIYVMKNSCFGLTVLIYNTKR